MESTKIFGLKSPGELDQRPAILTPSSKSSQPLFHIEFELAPIEKQSDYRFVLLMEPMTVLYHAVCSMKAISNE